MAHYTTDRKRLQIDQDGEGENSEVKRQHISTISGETLPEKADGKPSDGVDPVAYWAREQCWPQHHFEGQSQLVRLLARKTSPSSWKGSGFGSSTSLTPSDQRPREKKTAPYRDPRYAILLAMKGSFMNESELGLKETSKSMVLALLEMASQYPQDSLFRDDIFAKTCHKLNQANEARLIRDITPLIVPSAENLAIYGARELDRLIESVNEDWTNCIPLTGTYPQPDYSVGFRREAFTNEQLKKLEPLIGDFLAGDESFFMATYLMYFPFLMCEVRPGEASLGSAERHTAHSATLAVRVIVELFQRVKRREEVNRRILAFSITHNQRLVRIIGHYAVTNDQVTKFYRHHIREYFLDAQDGKDKWTAYKFTQNVYDWMPAHFKMICSAIDQLPSN